MPGSPSRARRSPTALAGLGPEPVTHLINTHWHFDHANGNEWLHELGPQILAQENTLKHLSTMQRVEDWDYDFAPLSAAALPTEVFATERTLKLNGTTLALKYYGPAHTDSDISVQFTEADILHTGDTFWNGIYPFIDYSTGGSIDGSIRAADANLAADDRQDHHHPGPRAAGQQPRPSCRPFATCWSAFATTWQHSSSRAGRWMRSWPPSRPRPTTRSGASS